MISRDCQKYFLSLLYEYAAAESKLDNSREMLWARIIKPAHYIDIFKAFLTKKSETGEGNWSMDLDDLKILLEDLEIKFKWEELKPLCGLISKSWSREKITFVDFLNFVLPDVESVEFIQRKLIDTYREELSQTMAGFSTLNFFKKENVKEGDAININGDVKEGGNEKEEVVNNEGYKFDIETFEITLDDENKEESKDVKLPLLLKSGRKKTKMTRKEKKRSLLQIKPEILSQIKQLFQDELNNFRGLKIRSRLVSGEQSFTRRKLFHMIDFENNGVISYKNINQFTIKHAKPLKFKKLKLLYRRMKLDLQEKITFKEFMKIFIDCYNSQEMKERHFYNFYYKREGERRLKLKSTNHEDELNFTPPDRWITGFNYTKGKIRRGKIVNGEFYQDFIEENLEKSELKKSNNRRDKSKVSSYTERKKKESSPDKKSKSVMWSSRRGKDGTLRLMKEETRVHKRNFSKKNEKNRETKDYSLVSNYGISIDSLSSIQIDKILKNKKKQNMNNNSSIAQKSSHQNSVVKNINLKISPEKKIKFRIGILSKTRKNLMNLKECLKRVAVYFKYLSTCEAKIVDSRELMAIHYLETLREALHYLFGKGDRLSLFSIQKGLAEKLGILVENGDIKLILSRVNSKVSRFL